MLKIFIWCKQKLEIDFLKLFNKYNVNKFLSNHFIFEQSRHASFVLMW